MVAGVVFGYIVGTAIASSATNVGLGWLPYVLASATALGFGWEFIVTLVPRDRQVGQPGGHGAGLLRVDAVAECWARA